MSNTRYQKPGRSSIELPPESFEEQQAREAAQAAAAREARIENAARLAHEANAALCRAFGDDSQPAWEDAPDWQKDSARSGVEKILDGEVTEPGQSHESWSALKIAEGWTFGEVKDPEAKTHPCLVPFDELPAEQQAKDHVFVAVVKAALAE